VESDFSARRWHFGERRHADRNVIADPVSFHDRLVRTFRQQSPAKMRNHSGYCTAVSGSPPGDNPPQDSRSFDR
jgi:hypothetical protein